MYRSHHDIQARRVGVRLGLLLLVWLIPAWCRADLTYTVKRNDTLSSISRKHGVSIAKLAAHNGIKQSNKIYVGQRLRIPSRLEKRVPYAGLPEGHNRVRVSSRWKHLVIHHSGMSMGDVKSMDRYHREQRRMENGLAYHFVIGNGRPMRDGEIAMGGRWLKQLDGGHLASAKQNHTSIGICLVGDFEKQRPTPKQLESLEVLIHYLMERCSLGVDAVKSHQQINVIHTKCPGKHFPMQTVLREIKAST